MAEDEARDEGEFEIIARIFAPLARETGALDLKDDAAVLMVSEGHELVVTCDTLVEGVHFLQNDPPRSIGHKALAVNLSDLTAKGARGYVYTLSLALPKGTGTFWIEEFAAGLSDVQAETDISLIGGDTTATPGPPTITITALGLVSHQHAVMRLGAKPGDRLYVSGTIGDAYLGLRLLGEPNLAETWGLTDEDVAFLVDRYRRPAVNNRLAILIRNFAQASIDVSDGLVGDIEKLCRVSHVGASDRDRARAVLPCRQEGACARARPAPDSHHRRRRLRRRGGGFGKVGAAGFESEAEAAGAVFSMLGTVAEASEGVRAVDAKGQAIPLKRKGFSHF